MFLLFVYCIRKVFDPDGTCGFTSYPKVFSKASDLEAAFRNLCESVQ